jgi:putative addiction module component (TIGR02574 family)
MSTIAIEKLSTSEKLMLVERLWDSLDKTTLEVTEAQKLELENRLKKHNAGETKYSTWEEVKHRLNSRI